MDGTDGAQPQVQASLRSGLSMAERTCTPELVRQALDHLSPDMDNDAWAKVGIAIKSEYPDETGFDLFDAWSSRGESYRANEMRTRWRSFKAAGRTTIATLFGMAKDAGFVFPKADGVQTSAPDREALQRQAEKRQQQREAEEAQYRARADQAAKVARGLWDEGLTDVASPYAERKGVGQHGTRCMPDGTLLVPMVDIDGQLQNLQRIAPTRPATGSDKRFLPGGRKSGLMHVVGSIEGDTVLAGEGYATVATLHEATGLPAVVAFDAGNLVHVVKALRAKHPSIRIVVCGDDDRGTAERTGANPGREKAAAAVRAAKGGPALAVFPEALPEGASDFNDQAAAHGIDSVRETMRRALAELEAVAEPVAAADDDEPPPWVLAEDPSSPPPSPQDESGDPSEALAPAKGGKGRGKRPSTPEDEAEAARKAAQLKALFEQVGTLAERFSLIYGTDTAWDASRGRLVKISAMKLAFGSKAVNVWLARPSRRMVDLEDLVFEPGVEVGPHQINMFRGLSLEPVACDSEDVAPMLRLLRHLCATSADTADEVDAIVEWVLRWMALPLQQVGTKMQTALIFHGPQGTGKNLFFDAWRDLFGEYGKTIGQTEIEDKYNEWISCKLAFVANEVVSRQEMYHRKDALKMIVTEEKGFPIRGMHMATRWERNAANIVFLSNQRIPLALEDGDRRHMVVYTPMAADDELYLAVRDFLRADGLRKWLHYLMTYPLGDFGQHTKPPLTKDKQRLIQANWRAPARFAHEWLEGYLDLPLVPCSGDQAYRAFQRWCYLAGEKFPPNRDTFTEDVNRWAQENAGKDDAGRRLPPLMECKVVQHKDAVGHRRAIRTWLPRGTGPKDGATLGEWAFESAEKFQAALNAFCGSRMSDEVSA